MVFDTITNFWGEYIYLIYILCSKATVKTRQFLSVFAFYRMHDGRANAFEIDGLNEVKQKTVTTQRGSTYLKFLLSVVIFYVSYSSII